MATDGASYTGMALANNGAGNFLYLADFENGKIDVLDGQFDLTELAGDFVDPHLPDNFAPFNVAAINGKLYVAFAQQNASGEEVTGRGRGFVSVFDLNGNFLERLVNRGRLDAPWAMVQAPSDFGEFSGDLLVGNFGDGRINAYDPETGKFQGALTFRNGKPLVIDGLWGLAFGNGVTSGDKNTLYYAAGPDNETHGLFGKITANPDGTNPVKAAVVGSDLVITGSRIDDDVFVRLTSSGNNVAVFSSNQSIGTFPIAGLSTIQFNGFAGNDSIAVSSNVELTTVLDGGAGNDFVIGGGGNNILLGGPGSDFVSGRGDRDILIGGDGRDILSGFSGDDILIGGRTAHDGNTGALLGILGVWTNADSYEDRVAAIRAGMPKLDSTTVFDDAAFDLMLGLGGRDWYWSFAPDLILGLQGDETVN
jgi:Ca2+-binding RTX toxin-like protein